MRWQHTVYANSARVKYIVRRWSSRRLRYVTAVDGGTWSVSPQYRDLRTRELDTLASVTLKMLTKFMKYYWNYQRLFLLLICSGPSSVLYRLWYSSRTRVRKSRNWGEALQSPIHCCDVTKPPFLVSGEICTSPFHSKRFFVYPVCCRRGGQCFFMLRTRHTDVLGDGSGRSYITE